MNQPVSALTTINYEIKKVAPLLQHMLPPEITPDRLRSFTMSCLIGNEKLQQCSVASLLGAVYASARVGIEPDGILACVVPRKGVAQFQLMFRGAVALAQRSGMVKNVWAEVVHENDEFSWQLGTDPKIEHKPAMRDRGELRFVYACARFTDGYVQFRVLDREEIKRARAAAQTQNVWNANEPEMWRKTAVHRLCKLLPMPAAAQRALDLDEAALQGRDQGLADEWEGLRVSQEQPKDPPRVRPSTIDTEATSDQIPGPPEGDE